MKKPALNNAGLQNRFEVFRVLLALPELFSWLFYVAASRLNSPRFSSLVIRLTNSHCQAVAVSLRCLCASAVNSVFFTAEAQRARRQRRESVLFCLSAWPSLQI